MRSDNSKEASGTVQHKSRRKLPKRLRIALAFFFLLVVIVMVVVCVKMFSPDIKQEPAKPSTESDSSIIYEDLNKTHLEALALVKSGDLEAAYKLAATDVSDAEKLGDKNKIYNAKVYQAIVFWAADDKQQTLAVYKDILNMDIEKSQILPVLYYMIGIYKDLGDKVGEKKYLEYFVELAGGIDTLPQDYADRLKELEDV